MNPNYMFDSWRNYRIYVISLYRIVSTHAVNIGYKYTQTLCTTYRPTKEKLYQDRIIYINKNILQTKSQDVTIIIWVDEKNMMAAEDDQPTRYQS